MCRRRNVTKCIDHGHYRLHLHHHESFTLQCEATSTQAYMLQWLVKNTLNLAITNRSRRLLQSQGFQAEATEIYISHRQWSCSHRKT